MYITLYEGVELRSDYSVVFDASTSYWGTNTPFAEYLASKNYYSEEISDTYFSNDGSISISWPIARRLPQGITYMRIFTEQNEIKYFFVNSYEYRNEVLVLNYTLDVWHTYSNDMKIHSGILDKAKYAHGRKVLPMAYQTNKPFIFNATPDEEFYIVAQIQALRLTDSADETIDRFTYTTLVGHRGFYVIDDPKDVDYTPDLVIDDDTKFTFTLDEAMDTINELTAHQNREGVRHYDLGNGWAAALTWEFSDGVIKVIEDDTSFICEDFGSEHYDKPKDITFEIIQLYTVPRSLLYHDYVFDVTVGHNATAALTVLDTVERQNFEWVEEADVYTFKQYHFAKVKREISEKDILIPADKKTIGVGLASMYIPLPYNGLEHIIRFRVEATLFGFAISILGEEGISEITSQFAIPLPYTTPSGTERQLAALNKSNARWQAGASAVGLALTVVSAIQPIAGAIAQAGLGTANLGRGIRNTSEYQKLKKSGASEAQLNREYNRQLQAREASVAAAIGKKAKVSVEEMAKSGLGLTYMTTNLLTSLNKAMSPASTGNTSETQPLALINAAYGFSTYSVDPINEEEVDYLIDRIGYDTWIEQNDYHTFQDSNTLKGKYEPISFAVLHITGPFPNDIAAALEDILTDGALISYDPDIFNKL